MANRKVTMTDLRVIVREFARGTSLREMERKLGVSRTSLRPYRERALESGKTMQELLQLEDAELYRLLSKGDGHRSRDTERYAFMQEHIEEYAHKMTWKYMTFEVLYSDYYCPQTDHPYGYTQFKAIIQEYQKKHNLSYHNVYEPAREMQFDFAGDPLWVVDTNTGECQQAIVLVCVLPYSMMSYAVAMLSTKMEIFFSYLSKALEYFGGVPEVCKTDNMTQWVKKYDRYEPALNDVAQQWSLSYGTEMEGCRVRKPRDKGPAEGLVDKVYKFYYSRAYHMTWTSIEQLNEYLMQLNDMYNDRVMQHRGHSRRKKYEEEEKQYMLPLPVNPYRFKYEKKVKINSTYHFQIERNRFYSVPYQYVGEQAKIVYDSETVEVWINMKRVATHRRMYHDGYTTVPEHMPENHRAYAASKEYNAAYFLKRAGQIGPETKKAVDNILQSAVFVQQSYRACQGVIRLVDRFGADRVEDACRKIEPKTAATYKRIKAILEAKLDLQPDMEDFENQAYIPSNDNVRGATAYR